MDFCTSGSGAGCHTQKSDGHGERCSRCCGSQRSWVLCTFKKSVQPINRLSNFISPRASEPSYSCGGLPFVRVERPVTHRFPATSYLDPTSSKYFARASVAGEIAKRRA
jgi:hypothetical protein